jgi:hypothetical protein
MRISIIVTVTVLCPQLCSAQTPAVNNPPDPLAPGIVMSLYGSHLGPGHSCEGFAIPNQHQTPSPLRPQQSGMETAIYPEELCGVQVFVNNTPAGLLYVHEKQINFKAPQDTPMSGTGQIRVVYESRSSQPVPVKLGLGLPTVSLKNPAYVGLPVWVEIQFPSYQRNRQINYPLNTLPADFKCHRLELRHNGVLVPQSMAVARQASAGGPTSGLYCGSVARSSEPAFMRRLPLHLQYQFDKPGKYEVRYTELKPKWPSLEQELASQSEWTPIEILPSTPASRARWFANFTAHPPTDAGTLTSDFLPSIMAVTTAQSLRIVQEYLYHPDRVVRMFAMAGLSYWPQDQARDSVLALVRARGPSEEALWYLRTVKALAPVRNELLEQSLPLLQAGSIVQLSGVFALIREPVDAVMRARLDTALISARDHTAALGDPQTAGNYASALYAVEDPRVHDLLWELIDSNVAREQAAIVVAWRHDPADLPRLAKLNDIFGLPYQLRKEYGEAATPYLIALMNTATPQVRVQSARELMLAGNKTAFAFTVDAIENNKPWKRELIPFIRESFPGMRGADDSAILQFAKSRAQ